MSLSCRQAGPLASPIPSPPTLRASNERRAGVGMGIGIGIGCDGAGGDGDVGCGEVGSDGGWVRLG